MTSAEELDALTRACLEHSLAVEDEWSSHEALEKSLATSQRVLEAGLAYARAVQLDATAKSLAQAELHAHVEDA